MRKMLKILALVLGLPMVLPAASEAEGPFCFTVEPFANLLVMFVEGTVANQFVGSGRDLASGAAVHFSGYVSGTSSHLAFTNSPDSTSGFPVLFGATVSIFTAAGPGRCHRVNSTEGCGTGSSITLAAVSCPADATTDAPPDAGLL